MSRAQKGVIAPHRADFNVRRMMGGIFNENSVSGQLCHGELYNNDTTGRWLYVYGVMAAGASPTQFTLESYQGQKGTPTGNPDYNPIIIGGPSLPGVIGVFATPACVGVHMGMCPGPGGGSTIISPFPIAAIPPGYSYCVESQTATLTIVGAFWWLVDKAP